MRTLHWFWAGLLLAGHALLGGGCSSDDNSNLTPVCGPSNQCQGCTTCVDDCTCKGGDPTTCSSQCGSAAEAGPAGCSTAPDCNSCTACFDTCLCATGNAQSCLNQCLVDAGSGGFGGFGAGPGTGGGAGTGAVGGGGVGATGGGGTTCATPFNSGVPACDNCVNASCCSQVGACQANGACQGLQSCLSQFCANTPNVQTCFQNNCSQFAGGLNAYNAMAQCILGTCNGPC